MPSSAPESVQMNTITATIRAVTRGTPQYVFDRSPNRVRVWTPIVLDQQPPAVHEGLRRIDARGAKWSGGHHRPTRPRGRSAANRCRVPRQALMSVGGRGGEPHFFVRLEKQLLGSRCVAAE